VRLARSQVWLLLIRGDRSMNEVKVGKVAGFGEAFVLPHSPKLTEHFGCEPGYLGPVGLARASEGGCRPGSCPDGRFGVRRQSWWTPT